MNTTLRVVMLIAIVAYFLLLCSLLKKKKLQLKYSLLWLFSGILMLLVIAFPQLLLKLSLVVGIYDPVNALFAVLFFCNIIIMVSLTTAISKQNEQIKDLAQRQAMLEKQLCVQSKNADSKEPENENCSF